MVAKTGKSSLVCVVLLSALGLLTATASAAPPANDAFPNAAPASIGFSEELDTTEATTDADDAQLNSLCGAPATDASVWYALEGTDESLVVDVSQSDYTAGLLVGVGTQGNLELITCGPGAVAFFAAAGTTYYVLAFDDQADGSGNGGLLNISFNVAPPPPDLSIAVDRFGDVDSRTGEATLSGTYVCTGGDFIDAFIDVRQRVGRFFVLGTGFFSEFGTCDGETHEWSATIIPGNGKFAGGKAATITVAIACGQFECAEGYVEQTVQLRSRRRE